MREKSKWNLYSTPCCKLFTWQRLLSRTWRWSCKRAMWREWSPCFVPRSNKVSKMSLILTIYSMLRLYSFKGYRPETELLYQRAERSAHLLAKWPSLLMQIFFRSTMVLASVASVLNDLRNGHIDIKQWYSLHFLECVQKLSQSFWKNMNKLIY